MTAFRFEGAHSAAPRLLDRLCTEDFPWFPIARLWGDTSIYGRIRAWLGMAALGLRKGALFRRVFGAQCPDLDQQQLDRFTASFALNRDAKRTALRQFRQMLRPGFFRDFDAMRRRILDKAPCRVLWGAKDKFVPVQYAHRFGSKQVTILPEAGHWVALTDPDALAAEVDAIGGLQVAERPASTASLIDWTVVPVANQIRTY